MGKMKYEQQLGRTTIELEIIFFIKSAEFSDNENDIRQLEIANMKICKLKRLFTCGSSFVLQQISKAIITEAMTSVKNMNRDWVPENGYCPSMLFPDT